MVVPASSAPDEPNRAAAILDPSVPTELHAYHQDHQHLLTQPANPNIGVSTSDANGEW